MKSNSLTTLLLGVLAVSALASVVLCMAWIYSARDVRNLQQQVAAVQFNQQRANMLANELVAYSQKNPAIDPVLQWANIKAKPASGGTTQPPR